MSSTIGDALGDANVMDSSQAVTAGPAPPPSLDDRLTLVGIRMVYIALTFFFGSFYFAFTYLDLVNENSLWLPKTMPRPPLGLGIAEETVLFLAGLIYFGAQWFGLYRRDFKLLNMGLALTTLLGFAAFAMHVQELHNHNFGVEDGGYASVFVGLEAVFTAVLLISLIVLIGLTNRARRGLFAQSSVAIDAFGEFWGWLNAIALANFLLLYVVPFFPIS